MGPGWWNGEVTFSWRSPPSLCWLFLSPKGRLPRRETSLGALILLLILAILVASAAGPLSSIANPTDVDPVVLIIVLPSLSLVYIGFMNLVTKRFHDIDWRGHPQFIPLLPLLLMAVPEESIPADMRVGFLCLILLAMLVMMCWILVQLLSIGTSGPNRFGLPFGTAPQQPDVHSQPSGNVRMEAYIVELVARGYPEQQARDYVEMNADHFE